MLVAAQALGEALDVARLPGNKEIGVDNIIWNGPDHRGCIPASSDALRYAEALRK